jgi:chromosome segregation ATPase
MNGIGVSWRDYVEERFKSLQRAVDKAEESLTLRLESMNEFRAQINNERRYYVSKAELESLEERLNKLENAQSKMEGRLTTVAGAITVVFTVIQILLHFVK